MHGAESRSGNRFLCSELVRLEWTSQFGRSRSATANLEEIEERGAVLQCDGPIRRGTRIRIRTPGVDLNGVVLGCTADFIGYFLEVEFVKGSRWSREVYEPAHLLDPRSLTPQAGLREKNRELLAECYRLLAEVAVC